MRERNRLKLPSLLALAMVFAAASTGLHISAKGESLPGALAKPKPAPTVLETRDQSGTLPSPAEKAPEEVAAGVPEEGEPTPTAVRELPPVKGPKRSIAVMDFEDKSGFSGEWNLGEGMADMLASALEQTNSFIVSDRAKIKKILQERNLTASGRSARVAVVRTGKVILAQIGIAGTVTDFSFEEQERPPGSKEKGEAPGLVTGTAHVAIDLRILDGTTERVLFSERVEKKGTYTGIEGEYTNKSFAIGGEDFDKTPLGKATREAINEAVYWVAVNAGKIPWKGNIVIVQGEKVVINCGKREGIAAGQKFVVYSKGEELTDPETGEILGLDETRAGTISVAEVQERHSIARIEEGGDFRRGDILRVD